MTTVKVQRRIRVAVRVRVRATSMVLINAIVMVIRMIMIMAVAFTCNPSVVSPLLPPEKVLQGYGYSSCSRPWYQRVRLRGTSLRWHDEQQQYEYFNAKRVIYRVLHISTSGAIEEPDSSSTPEYFYDDDEEEEEMMAEVMNVSPEDLASATSASEKDDISCRTTTPEEQYWSVFGHEKGFLDGPLNPMHQRLELLEHLEKHPSTVKNVIPKRTGSTTIIYRGRGGVGGGTGASSNIERIGSGVQSLVTGVVDGSAEGNDATAGLQPLIRGETSIERHLQALFDANIAEHQVLSNNATSKAAVMNQGASVLNRQDNGTTPFSITNLTSAAEKKQIQHNNVVRPDISIIHDRQQQQQQYQGMGTVATLEAPCDDSPRNTFPNKNNDETIVADAQCCHSAGETGRVEIEYTKLNLSHPGEMVLPTVERGKSTVVEGSVVPPNWMMKSRENRIQQLDRPDPKAKQLLSTESRGIPINEMVRLFVNEKDSIFEDRMLCPRCFAPSPEDELKLNGGCCMACHSEDVGEEFCVNYGIQKKSNPPHLSTRGRIANSTKRGGIPSPVFVASSTAKKSKTLYKASNVPSSLSDQVNVLERKIEQVLNNTSSIMTSLKCLESRLDDMTSIYAPHSKETIESPNAGDFTLSSPPPSTTDAAISHLSSSYAHHRNETLLKAGNSRGPNKMYNYTRSSKVLEDQQPSDVVFPLVKDDETKVHRGLKSTVATDTVERWRSSRAKVGKQQKPHKRQMQMTFPS